MKLQDKVAIVTGAGSGIGRAIATLFCAEGAKVLLVDLRNENIEALAGEIREAEGTALCYPADISRSDEVENLVSFTLEQFGRVDILVNNAGIMDDFTPAGDTSNELWDRLIAVNLTGTFLMTRTALGFFTAQRSGVIVNVASIGGLFGGRAGAAYTASKHGVIGLTKSVGYQYAGQNIRCNAIAPGGVATSILTDAHPHPFGFERMSAGVTNAPGTGDPEDIAGIALFLASHESRFVNGSVITADAGWTAY
ncbi:3-ketoacyl-ACP reductase [Pedobacter yulinensis]|uniref:3-ketoacyl-ACP reductase n=1 Tax=Pedobacter yulinensis TaxID=2126353 RepID=A0A2T3HL36_9SPHI|nr:glucose 1-dehydrogenase [Pedobacter yulinensis]PST83157.1 3-ketoacyl-ACP reductase [Pedobacter yulinensis]